MATNKFSNLDPKSVHTDPPNGELFIDDAKVDNTVPTAKVKVHSINTYGNVDSRRTPTRNKNVKIREDIYDFIDQNTDGAQNVTLILNELLARGVANMVVELEHNDVEIKGA